MIEADCFLLETAEQAGFTPSDPDADHYEVSKEALVDFIKRIMRGPQQNIELKVIDGHWRAVMSDTSRMSLKKKRPELRAGDQIMCEGRCDGCDDIVWDMTTLRVIRPKLAVGNRVGWQEGFWTEGVILGLSNHAASNRAWAWIEVDGEWPPRTVDTGLLSRLEIPRP